VAVPQSIPRAPEPHRFREEPFAFLTQARAELGDVFVLREDGPILSGASDCSGTIAVFGAERQRAVLGDIESFGMPPSAAKQLALDETLANLNRSLHSMHGEEHAAQKRAVASVLDAATLRVPVPDWPIGSTIDLLDEMRKMTLRMVASIESDDVAELHQAYFHLRREVSSPLHVASEDDRKALIAAGHALDRTLRTRLRGNGLAGDLFGAGLTEDESVGHANILLVSATEPIAIALTWTLLILSQVRVDAPLDCVIAESLRLLPPNAFMVRVTTRPVSLCGVELPERCEIVLCPFVAHRDVDHFDEPDSFRPSRWLRARPSPFDYFPFGAGGHACVGRGLALQLMTTTLSSLLDRYDLLLDGDQEIDWRIHIQFMPRNDPRFVVRAANAPSRAGGKLLGPVASLLRLS
jgi:cytochrome P450